MIFTFCSIAPQVSTVSKVVREMHHLAPENSEVDYVSGPYQPDLASSNMGGPAPHSQYVGYMDHVPPSEQSITPHFFFSFLLPFF